MKPLVPQYSTLNPQPSTKEALTALTHLAFHINATIDCYPDFDLSYAEIHQAARLGRLVDYLGKCLRDKADLYLINSDPATLAGLETALRDAAAALRGRNRGKAYLEKSGLCLVMAIILEAIQQQHNADRRKPHQSETALVE